MFESLHDAFRQAVENFREELSKGELPEAADRLSVRLRWELRDAERRLRELEAQIEGALAESAREEEAARVSLRRAELAQEAGDPETASIGREFASRHRRRRQILAEKSEVLRREAEDRKEELAEMRERLDALLRELHTSHGVADSEGLG
jgi:hypothetical protein